MLEILKTMLTILFTICFSVAMWVVPFWLALEVIRFVFFR